MKNKSIIVIAFSLLTLSSCGQKENNNETTSAGNSKNTTTETSYFKVPNSQVCMVNNKFMSKEQIVVPVNNKIYYGCCQGCVATLKNDASSRLATDPLSGEQVDKAVAFIILKPGSADEVLYFHSEANAKVYLKNKN